MQTTLNEYREVYTNAQHLMKTFKEEYEHIHFTDSNYLSLRAQQLFLDAVIHHDTVKKFNVPLQHTVKFIKQYIHEIEHCRDGSNSEGVSEDLMELYWSLSSTLPAANDSFSQRHLQSSHRIYDISSLVGDHAQEEENLIVLKVWPAFTHVGLAMWEAGYYIAEWILANQQLFYGKRVLELGSGVGLSAITLARPYDQSVLPENLPKAIYMTDYTDIVLRNCVDNMKINGLEVVEMINDQQEEEEEEEEVHTVAHSEKPRLVHVSKLDWTNFSDEQLESIDANVILAADVIYDLTVIEGLVDITRRLIFNSKQKEDVIVYFAITKRNEKTFEFFKEECLRNGMITEDVTATSSHVPIFPYEGRGNVRMYKLSKSY